jgi:hypothetical protein
LSGKLVAATPLKILRLRLSDRGLTDEPLCKHLKLKTLEELPAEWVNEAMAWVAAQK